MIAGWENTPTYMQLENLALAEETKQKARPETTEEVLYANMNRGRGTFTPRGRGHGDTGSHFGHGAGRFNGGSSVGSAIFVGTAPIITVFIKTGKFMTFWTFGQFNMDFWVLKVDIWALNSGHLGKQK
ncbi:unnamed protein product [Calypogeia fissa]